MYLAMDAENESGRMKLRGKGQSRRSKRVKKERKVENERGYTKIEK